MIEYDKELIKILKISEQETIKMHRQYVSTEHIILAVLKSDNHIKNIFNKFNVYYDNYKSLIINNINSDSTSNLISYTPLLKKIILSSIKNNKVTLNNLIINILNEPNTLAVSLLNIIDIDINELYNSIKNGISINYGINLNKERNIDKLYYRENELNELIEALCKKNKSNALLIGEAGVGKTALVELLSQKIEKNEVPKELKNKEIISINMSSLVSGTRYRGEFEEKIENLINSFEKNDRYILFIDEIHTIIGAGGSEGAIDAANILKPYLARNKIKCIGSTTIKEYNTSIKKDKALNRRFQTILIKEPDSCETEKILLNSKKSYEKYHNVKISKKDIKNIIKLSNNYQSDKKEPDRSLEILDKACTKLKLNNYYTNNINKLLVNKDTYLKEKDFINAKIIDNKITRLKEKSKKLNINIIKSCFEKIITQNKIGFKAK